MLSIELGSLVDTKYNNYRESLSRIMTNKIDNVLC